MADIELTISETAKKDGSNVEYLVDEDIRKFDEHFQSLGNSPLVRSEIASIKTYLHFKLFTESKG